MSVKRTTIPYKPAPAEDIRHTTEFLFVEGDEVVGRVEADCRVCAWNEGHPKWPKAQIALWVPEPDATEDSCLITRYFRATKFSEKVKEN